MMYVCGYVFYAGRHPGSCLSILILFAVICLVVRILKMEMTNLENFKTF